MELYDVSVVMCTYNRCAMLPRAIESVLAQDPPTTRFELIVVDNNSTDRTRQVIESYAARHRNVRYVFQPEQGLPNARNAGVARASASIIAFTDDDVRVAPDWVASIVRAFREYPNAAFIGGKVLPAWEADPPAWLTREHWSPIAVQDHGEWPLVSSQGWPMCLIGANMAFRRAVLERVGPFDPACMVVRAGAAEDHEIQLRIWRLGGYGMYVPYVVVEADVQAERLTKAYHRKWYDGHGVSLSLLRLPEALDPDGRLLREPVTGITLFGVPGWLFRTAGRHGRSWLLATARRREARAFHYECLLRELRGYMRHRYHATIAERGRSWPGELLGVASALVRRRLGRTRSDAPARLAFAHAGQAVAQGVPEHRRAEHRRDERQPRGDRYPRRADDQLASAGDHVPPTRDRRLHAESEKRESTF
jgi:glycosyltransferase involved in cell wall biosynthesis